MSRFSRIGAQKRKKRKKLLVFISTGDTCRAPMAAGYFSKLLVDRGIAHVEVRDAGIMTVPGLKATPEAIQILDTVDVDLRKHGSRKLSDEMVKRAELILGMSSFHVQSALRQNPLARSKTILLKEYVGCQEQNAQISDPMGGTLEIYKKCFKEIKDSCDILIDMPFIKDWKAPAFLRPIVQKPASMDEEEEASEPDEAQESSDNGASEERAKGAEREASSPAARPKQSTDHKAASVKVKVTKEAAKADSRDKPRPAKKAPAAAKQETPGKSPSPAKEKASPSKKSSSPKKAAESKSKPTQTKKAGKVSKAA